MKLNKIPSLCKIFLSTVTKSSEKYKKIITGGTE
jgi:hypothetical protein